MTDTIDLSRRFAVPLTAAAVVAAAARPAAARSPAAAAAPATQFGLDPTSQADQSARLQAAIDQTTQRGAALQLPQGKIIAGGVKLRPGTHLLGAAGAGSILSLHGSGAILIGSEAHNSLIDGVILDGARLPMDASRGGALLSLDNCRDIVIERVTVRNAALTGILLKAVSGRVHGCLISGIGRAALHSFDATGLDIAHNTISDCADNGILIWRTRHGEDGTTLSHNRIYRIRSTSGGSGQNGNGINIYRAGRVLTSNNMISDCAYTAIRANEASNVQMIANSAMRIGEVAFYVEAADERAGAAGFEGAVLANNVVDDAATGLVVTNFNNGGRLAVIQGNLIRNLRRREQEPVDKRGEAIAVEADAVVSNNVIENAPTCGIMIGWGRHMREVIATGNLIRKSRIGIAVSGDPGGGQCLLTNNIISEAREGAIRAMELARPVGADLVSGKSPRNITVSGNTAV
jgi:uncharacterized secreted repeat protein (TIGR03808 family)